MKTKVQRLLVTGLIDCSVAQKTAREFALAQEFTPAESEEIVLAVTELASNLVKHAHGGELSFTPLENAGRAGLEIESQDRGPGIADVEQAMADGFSTAGGLGYGRGTVNRLMDELDITSGPDPGTRVLCRRWARPASGAPSRKLLEFGVATRARQGASHNGDTFIIKRWNDHLLGGIIDGLGHGPYAQRAAHTARHFVEEHYDQPLENIFRGVARACRATRGVVMALARFDSDAHLSFASIGNVEAKVWGTLKPPSFLVQRGILGANSPAPKITEHPWNPSLTLLLFSDGIKTHWQSNEFPGIEAKPAQLIVQQLLQALAKDEDDATIVAIKGRTT